MPIVGTIALGVWFFGWLLVIALGVELCCRRGWRRCRAGLVLVAVGLLWFSSTPWSWALRSSGRYLVTPSPDGRSEVWLRYALGNHTVVEWRDPTGQVRQLDAGPTRTLFGEGCYKPQVFVWLPGGDSFYVGNSYAAHRGPIVEAATGARRSLTPAEIRWLLSRKGLPDWERRFLKDRLGTLKAQPAGGNTPSSEQANPTEGRPPPAPR